MQRQFSIYSLLGLGRFISPGSLCESLAPLVNYRTDTKKRENLLKAFRSEDNREHLSAIFELYLHHLLSQLGFGVVIEPDGFKGKPDFLVTAPSGEQFIIEATSVFSDAIFGTAKLRENQLLDEINKRVKSPYFYLLLDVKSAPTAMISGKKLCKDIENELSKINYDSLFLKTQAPDKLGLKRYPKLSIRPPNWDVEFRVAPKSQIKLPSIEDDRIILSVSYDAKWIDTITPVNSKIKSKYDQAGDLSIPYVLAINIIDIHVNLSYIAANSLLSREVFDVYLNSKTHEADRIIPRRQADGAWFDPKWRPQKTRLSAVLLFNHLDLPRLPLVEPVLWHHPYPAYSLNPMIWPLQQNIPDQDTKKYKYLSGSSAFDALAIDLEIFRPEN